MKSIASYICIIVFGNPFLTSANFIDPGARFVEFEGWGSSLAWFGDVLGGMPQDVQDEINYSLFSTEKLNLNILRYTIGGTTPGNYTCGPYRAGGATESFKDGSDLSYDWSRDSRARKILLAARELGVDTFEAFSNSPPQWMTISGCSKGNEGGGSLHVNFDPVNADLFTDYLTDVVKHYHDTYNLDFQSLAPFNEPSSGYWNGRASGQEGCCFERSAMARVIGSLAEVLQRKNMSYTSISVADETSIDVECTTQDYFRDQGLTGVIRKVNTHGYGGSRRDLLYSISQKDGHVLWMDEMGWSAGGTSDMTQGLNVANRIVLDMRTLLPSAWVYWQVMEDQANGAWGLVDVPYNNPSLGNIRYNSGYYTMMQFSKYIRKGSTFIHINDRNAVAAYDRNTNILVLVIVNNGGSAISKSYSLDLFTSFNTISATRTSSSEQNIAIPAPSVDDEKKLSYAAPPMSVTTIRIEDAIESDISRENQIRNNDFETMGSDAWQLFFGDNGGANSDYTRRGRYSGFIRTQSTALSLNQDLIAPETRDYHLTAWCASSGSSAKLGVKVNDIQGPELSVARQNGYDVYGISFHANQGDKISVYLYAPLDQSESFIDDVILH